MFHCSHSKRISETLVTSDYDPQCKCPIWSLHQHIIIMNKISFFFHFLKLGEAAECFSLNAPDLTNARNFSQLHTSHLRKKKNFFFQNAVLL